MPNRSARAGHWSSLSMSIRSRAPLCERAHHHHTIVRRWGGAHDEMSPPSCRRYLISASHHGRSRAPRARTTRQSGRRRSREAHAPRPSARPHGGCGNLTVFSALRKLREPVSTATMGRASVNPRGREAMVAMGGDEAIQGCRPPVGGGSQAMSGGAPRVTAPLLLMNHDATVLTAIAGGSVELRDVFKRIVLLATDLKTLRAIAMTELVHGDRQMTGLTAHSLGLLRQQ